MKILKYIILLSVVFGACQNKDTSFPDYKYNAVYFPFQYPIRTLILGDSRSDNSLDKKHQFNIGVNIGGMYVNKKSWDVNFMVDESLVPSNLKNTDGISIKVLPASYYTLSPVNKAVIPSGSFSGLINVQLTDAFFTDPLAVTGTYVIPLVITSSSADSVLTGVPEVPNPNRNVATDWNANALPKDYTLFGIKFINAYHGTYLHRGKDVTLDNLGAPVSTVVYHQQYVEKDQLWKLTTSGKNTVLTDGIGSKFTSSTKLLLDFAADGNIIVKPGTGSTIQGNGTGKYVENAETWDGTKHHAMYLNYTYKDGAINHAVTDTLVFRDNGVVFEEFKVQIN